MAAQGVDNEAEVLLDDADLLAEDESGKRRISLPPPLPEAARAPRVASRPPPLPVSRSAAPMAPGSLPPPTQSLPPMAGAGLPQPSERPQSGVRPLAPPPAGIASVPAPAGAGTLPPPAAPAGVSSAPRPTSTPPAADVVLRQKLEAARRELSQAQEQRNRLLTRLMESERRVQLLQGQLRERDERISQLQSSVADRPDDLKRIQGIGAGFEQRLRAEGIERFDQIAAWTLADLERVSPRIKTTPARIMRDGWVEQAQTLAAAKASGA